MIAGTEDFVYDDLRNASLAVRRGADFIATGRDPTYPQPDGMWPGTGALLAAVEIASESKAEIVGKPNPQLLLTALDRLGEGRTLVVGDRVDSDLAAAAGADLDAALVKTGGQDRGRRRRRRAAAGGRGGDAGRAHPALSSRSSSGGSTPTSSHASHAGVETGSGRRRQRGRRVLSARLVQVRGAERARRTPCGGRRARPPPRASAARAAAAPAAPPEPPARPRARPPARGATRGPAAS